jgi:hypothetical protein
VSDDDRDAQADLSTFGEGQEESSESDTAESPADTSEPSADSTESSADTGESSADGTASRAEARATDGQAVGEMDAGERVELALDLLAHLEADDLPLAAVVDRIETVTTNPSLTREILDTAELRGIIDREGGRIRTRRGGTYVRFEQQVVERDGEFDCRRCGASISTGHFVRFDAGELGPFGSSCIRTVLGRD